MHTTTEERILRTAMTCGAFYAAGISTDQIVLDEQFRQICETNRCGRYGKCYQCPPDIGDIHGLTQKIRSFPRAVIYQSVATLEDSFDFIGMMDAAVEHMQLSQRIQDSIPSILSGNYLHLSSGCRLCERCAKESGLPCRYPKKALGAVEGYGIDVYQTIQNTPLKYNNGENTVTYFGAILFTE